jgi:hypothetical protein
VLKRFILIAIAITILSCSRPAKTLDARLTSELDRLDASLGALEKISLPDELKSVPKAHRQAVARARAATSTDLRLYRIRAAYIGVEMLAFLNEQKKAGESIEALRALWNQRKPDFDAKPAVRGSLLQRALAEAAGNRAEKLFTASLPYAISTDAFTGLYYFAEAEGNLRFRRFVESLPGDSSEKPANASAVREALEGLESKTLQTFERDRSGRSTIAVSARLKESREQLEQNFVDGAALTLVEARMLLDRRNADAGVPAQLQALTQQGAVASAKPVRPASVTVTLVRWPYT